MNEDKPYRNPEPTEAMAGIRNMPLDEAGTKNFTSIFGDRVRCDLCSKHFHTKTGEVTCPECWKKPRHRKRKQTSKTIRKAILASRRKGAYITCQLCDPEPCDCEEDDNDF